VIRILLVDDHAVVRAGYHRFLEHDEDMRVVGEAEDAEQGYALFRQHQPDVCVIDLSMPGVGGLDLIRRICSQSPQACVLAFSMHEEPVFAQRALQAGARGYVTKQSAPDVLVQAVRELHAGRRFISQDMARDLAQGQTHWHPSSVLSPREFEVFRLIAQGQSVQEVAESLSLSQKTVSNHLTQLKDKLGATSTVALVHLALRHKVIALDY
jgi:DNA-binding NarL/FixJ family response regulator